MFRKTKRYEKYENMRRAKERKRLEGEAPIYPAVLPQKRREIIIRDFDFGKRERKIVMLKYRDRNDQYIVEVDGKRWDKPAGWTFIVDQIRKAYPRIRAL